MDGTWLRDSAPLGVRCWGQEHKAVMSCAYGQPLLETESGLADPSKQCFGSSPPPS